MRFAQLSEPSAPPALHLTLVAMPGAGKTTAGRQLAHALRLPFYDADHVLEQRIGMSIRSFFELEGEAAFRDLEEKVIVDLIGGEPKILATGGGAVLRPANRRTLHEGSTVVYLRATPDELFRRLRHDQQRPLLQVADPQRKLRELFQDRDPLYRETAHFVIETGRPSVSHMVQMILGQLELAGLVDPAQVQHRPVRA